MIINYRGKKINVSVKKVSFFGRFIGLMFRTKKTRILLFDFGKKVKIPIHSFFVFFNFLAVWLDGKNEVIELKIVKPFRGRVCPSKNFSRLVEIPLNDRNKQIIQFFVGNGKV